MPWPLLIPLISAAISAGGSIGSALIGSKSSKTAAQTQAEAAEELARQAAQTGERSAQDITAAGERGAGDVEAAAAKAAQGAWLSAEEANALLKQLYGNVATQLEPYTATGRDAIQTLNAAMGPEGDFNRPFTGGDLQKDPGYQFRLEEGQKALERSAAARGTLLGGGTLKALERYAQGTASEEYGAAFNRFRQDRADRFGMFYNLAGIGQRATEAEIEAGETYGGRAAGNIMTAGQYGGNMIYGGARDASGLRIGTVGKAGDYRMRGMEIGGNALVGAANAKAAGTMGAANAWGTNLANIGNTAMDFAYLATNRGPRQPITPMPVGPTLKFGYDPATGTFKPIP